MKKRLLSLILFVYSSFILVPPYPLALESPDLSQKYVPKELLEKALMLRLSPSEKKQFQRKSLSKITLEKALLKRLSESVLIIVGRNWNMGNEKILEITKENAEKYIVTVQLVSFEGMHNPPYIEETITFELEGYKIKTVNYFNRIMPKKEWDKIQF